MLDNIQKHPIKLSIFAKMPTFVDKKSANYIRFLLKWYDICINI